MSRLRRQSLTHDRRGHRPRPSHQPSATLLLVIGVLLATDSDAVYNEVDAALADSDTTVLILGETGTGKEMIARAIHDLSPRKGRTLIKVNCSTLPANLIESELFGHEKGAFTGSLARHLGRFEVADGSTFFLDEIGELPLELQGKLLRVLQDVDQKATP